MEDLAALDVSPDVDLEGVAPRLFDAVGLLPTTEKTPDIYYCDGPSSEKVAALSFLTLWFMDEPIQRLIKQRASAVICGLSPLSGGKRLEEAFNKGASITGVPTRRSMFEWSGSFARYTASCLYPQRNGDEMVRQGCLSVYATSISDDEINGYTALWQEKLERQFAGMHVPLEDFRYSPIYNRARSEPDFGVCTIFNAFSLSGHERDRALSQILYREFSDINSLYDMVTKRMAHEVVHLLEHGSGLIAHPFIQEEIDRHIPRGNRMLSHYRKASEAVAELGGIAILKRVQENAGLDFGMPTTMLDKILPDSYAYVDLEITKICAEPSL